MGEEAKRLEQDIVADRSTMEKNKELVAFLSGCRKRYFSMNPLITSNEYMT